MQSSLLFLLQECYSRQSTVFIGAMYPPSDFPHLSVDKLIQVSTSIPSLITSVKNGICKENLEGVS